MSRFDNLNESLRLFPLITQDGTGREILTISTDGVIVIGPGYTSTEAGEAFLVALIEQGIIVRRINMLTHYCTVDEHYMDAVNYCTEDDEGVLHVGNGEYSSVVNYCPFCGFKSKMATK